jgi:hypothetical protein
MQIFIIRSRLIGSAGHKARRADIDDATRGRRRFLNQAYKLHDSSQLSIDLRLPGIC